eukprot:1675574-Amphidinium_carterae.1
MSKCGIPYVIEVDDMLADIQRVINHHRAWLFDHFNAFLLADHFVNPHCRVLQHHEQFTTAVARHTQLDTWYSTHVLSYDSMINEVLTEGLFLHANSPDSILQWLDAAVKDGTCAAS